MKKETLFKLLSSGLIALASLSFITSTLAWYAASTILLVDTIEISVRGERELKVSTSTDIDTFKSELKYEELKKANLYMPVSTMFSSRWENEPNPVPTFYEYSNVFTPGTGIPYGPREMNDGFYQQSIYLYSNDDLYVSIDPDPEATYIIENDAANRAAVPNEMQHYPDLTSEEVLANLNNIHKALRFSIYDVSERQYYIIDTNKEGPTYYGGVLDNDKDEYFDTYSSDTNQKVKEVIYGEINDRNLAVYQDVGDEDINIAADERFSVFTAKHRRNTQRFLLEESLSNGLIIKEENSLELSDMESLNPNENKMVLELHRYEPKEIILSIYLEGWDLDCVNTNMGASFLAQLQFKILREI